MKSFLKLIPVSVFRFLSLGFSKGEHVTRFYMYNHLFNKYNADRRPEQRVLSISGSARLCEVFGFNDVNIKDASYPECNMLDLPFEDDSFDAVVSDQVLEHVEGNPQTAIDESIRVLKPGGLLVHATCFLNPIHGAPSDFWRFTPDALTLLVDDKVNILESAGWGNVFIWLFFALGLRYEQIPKSRLHPFNWLATFNQERLPVTTWIVAEKK